MKTKQIIRNIFLFVLISSVVACKSTESIMVKENRSVPENYPSAATNDSTNSADINWKNFFSDPFLIALIDSALTHNQELNITLQSIELEKNEAKARKGEYLPFAGVRAGAGVEKVGRYTRDGAVEEQLEIDGKKFPEPFSDFTVSAFFSWELDIWGKLRNAKKAATAKYLASVEGKNFMITQLVSEIASSYYELLSYDNQLETIKRNIEIQENALIIAKQQKEAARGSQLAVNRFEAQLLNTINKQFEIQQKIVETENYINFLVGRFPQPVLRNSATFDVATIDSIYLGAPSQLLQNRADVRKAEQELYASKFNVRSARAAFYPSIGLNANVGFQAFNPAVWFNPYSLIYNVFGDIMAPLLNRNAIQANFNSSKARQIQAVYEYQQTILKAYIEVINQQASIANYTQSYETKFKEVELLNNSIIISTNLFSSARADYMEVLLTQREAIDSKMELIEIKLKQLNSKIFMYKALGGGWK